MMQVFPQRFSLTGPAVLKHALNEQTPDEMSVTFPEGDCDGKGSGFSQFRF